MISGFDFDLGKWFTGFDLNLISGLTLPGFWFSDWRNGYRSLFWEYGLRNVDHWFEEECSDWRICYRFSFWEFWFEYTSDFA